MTVGSPKFRVKPTLRGDGVTLRPISADDARIIRPLLVDPEVLHLTGKVHSSTPTEDDLEEFSLHRLEEIYEWWAEDDLRQVWVIIDLEQDQIIGEAFLTDLDEGSNSCSFRIWISRRRDQGLGTEASLLALAYAFEEQHVHRVDLEVYDFNHRARHLYTKLGFVHEGTLREAMWSDGRWWDAHVMAMLRHEWDALYGREGARRSRD
ncbi:MAG: GNAT family protein [Nesterenkonia sp.]|uniref:GNAT family N-acetyltransferase n=1 Tax=Nesterenkonia marinintestina TaxID=2979865 RepID=UPI0021BE918A|nr:GNAT family protein [Nesterenkonia sp. GX14115]MDO5493036.1 GNAT family protein [Nesterenkonia sp.]